MPNTIYEVTRKFESPSSAQKLLYAPLPQALTYRESQCYKIDYEGDEEALRAFVKRVLLDPISQNLAEGGRPQWTDAAFILEYGMKTAALDLEKETILQYYEALAEPGFSIQKLTLRRRIYVFGEGAESAPFVRDVVNPAIHSNRVYTPAELTAEREAAEAELAAV
jgi:hypothetical protein